MAESKWEGKASANLVGSTPQEVWPHLADFFNLTKYLPSIDTCYKIEGEDGKPGLIRYCSSTITSSSGGSDEVVIKWCHEKLLEIDPSKWYFNYEALDNNMGIRSYFSTIKILPIDGGEEDGCEIEWSYSADPIEGFTFDSFLAYIDTSIHTMAENIGKAIQSTG
ncbi:hypothetical protein CsSME_00049261 [Camellia sinensis var. sinensis]|uniref:Bet v I/Major latex protein domain-containing protein n=1 Tax=Camellia sinensis var. sinensis TaxID=542762 RepID=A0A4S4D9J5_CAMSN|nr:lachrymatory-factor synthase-like [Camellia sinensis]THF99172.1 hypothetical protein TEA_010623 [Camellia sinensis var. sinensis]